jgi:hypothetical protein
LIPKGRFFCSEKQGGKKISTGKKKKSRKERIELCGEKREKVMGEI